MDPDPEPGLPRRQRHLRNTLVPANATEVCNSNDWLNEIHPNLDGYRKIANRLSERIDQVLR
jgi:lysophospholipase L1-like esterase